MRFFLSLPGAAYELLRLGVITRFDFKGPYWTWRTTTAFGRGMPSSRIELVRNVLEYARWARRLRRGL